MPAARNVGEGGALLAPCGKVARGGGIATNLMQARRVHRRGPCGSTPFCSPRTRPCHWNVDTHTHTVHLIAREPNAARHLRVVRRLPRSAPFAPPFAPPRPPAESLPALPYASPTRFHIKSSAPETAELHAEIGAGRVPELAIIVQNTSS